MNVSAKDLSTSKETKITITNDKDRLSTDDSDGMVREADKYRDEDEKQRERVTAKNQLENLCFTFKQAAVDASALSQADKDTVTKKCEEELQWVEHHQQAEKAEFERHQK